MKRLLVLVTVLILVGAATWAQTRLTGQWLHDGWLATQKMETAIDKPYADATAAYMYMGFVMGELRVMQGAGWLDPPEGVKLGQELTMVGKYLDDHPEEWNTLAEILLYKIFHAVWPGKKAAYQ